jgi:hypothetical protein
MNDIHFFNEQGMINSNNVGADNFDNDKGEDQHSILFNDDNTFYDTILEEACQNLEENRLDLHEKVYSEAMDIIRSIDEEEILDEIDDETSDEVEEENLGEVEEENLDEVEEENLGEVEEEIPHETEEQTVFPEYTHEDEQKYGLHLNLNQRKTLFDNTLSYFYLEMICHKNDFSENMMKRIYPFAY